MLLYPSPCSHPRANAEIQQGNERNFKERSNWLETDFNIGVQKLCFPFHFIPHAINWWVPPSHTQFKDVLLLLVIQSFIDRSIALRWCWDEGNPANHEIIRIIHSWVFSIIVRNHSPPTPPPPTHPLLRVCCCDRGFHKHVAHPSVSLCCTGSRPVAEEDRGAMRRNNDSNTNEEWAREKEEQEEDLQHDERQNINGGQWRVLASLQSLTHSLVVSQVCAPQVNLNCSPWTRTTRMGSLCSSLPGCIWLKMDGWTEATDVY